MKANLEIALEECLALLAKGESLAACLQRYPQEAAELALLLQIAKGIEGLRPQEPVSASVAARQRRLFLQRAAALEQEEQTTFQGFLAWLPLVRMPVPARMALAAVTVFALTLIIGAGAVLASGGDLGEALLQLIPEPLQEALGLDVEETPVPELVEVKFTGAIEGIGERSWVISGQTVLVDANTMVEGTPQVGLTAEVTALSQPDGSLLATYIEIEEAEPEFAVTPTIGEPDDGLEDEEEAEEEEEAEDEAEEDEEDEGEEEAEEEDEEDADEEEDADDDDEDKEDGDEENEDDEDEVTAQEAAAAILAAHAGILEAQAAINAAPEGVDISTAREKVEEAQEKLGEAEALYAAGDYAAVVDKAEDASQLADDALDALADAAEDVEGEEDDEEEDTDDGNEESNDGS